MYLCLGCILDVEDVLGQ